MVNLFASIEIFLEASDVQVSKVFFN